MEAERVTKVISVRVPGAVRVALFAHAKQLRRSPADVLRILISYSLERLEGLAPLADCPDSLDDKFDARIPLELAEKLKTNCRAHRLSSSRFVRKLLFHFYVTKKVKFIEEEKGHYNLAVCHDQA